MRTTPEGAVKTKVREILKAFGPSVYYFMPVQMGIGAPSLDFIGCCCGDFFAIECKADWKHLTPRQTATAKAMEDAQGMVFEIRAVDDPRLVELEDWLNRRVLRRKARLVKG